MLFRKIIETLKNGTPSNVQDGIFTLVDDLLVDADLFYDIYHTEVELEEINMD